MYCGIIFGARSNGTSNMMPEIIIYSLLCRADNKQSLEVEFEHLVLWSQKLALAVVDAPKAVLPILDAAAKEAVLEDWPEFSNIHQEIFVRFPTLSVIDSIRNLR